MDIFFLLSLPIVIFVVGIVFLYSKLKQLQEKNNELPQLRERLEHNQREVQESLEKVTLRVTDRLDKVTEQVGLRLSENVRALNESKSFLTERVDHTERTVREVTNKLAGLQEVSQKMLEMNKEILNFQQMLKVPKVRGGFGEILLESLLRDCLPNERYIMQYKFSSSNEIADAIIRLMDDMIVVIDSKFPLGNYEKIVLAPEGEEKKTDYRAFINDIKKHVKDISSKYISPQEKTLDYAFMYIPMEGIYYEMIVRRADMAEEIWDFCLKQRVIPVSPNSFLAYLHTLLMGFRGMRIEKQAKEMVQYISQIRKDFVRFEDEFALLGNHITHAKNKYDDSARRLEKFNVRLEKIDVNDPATNLPSEATSEVLNDIHVDSVVDVDKG